jgi:hypothetical protein
MNRGRRGEVVFLEEKDCLEFINLLKEACRIKEKVDNEPRADLTPILRCPLGKTNLSLKAYRFILSTPKHHQLYP